MLHHAGLRSLVLASLMMRTATTSKKRNVSERVASAAEAALSHHHAVSAVEMLLIMRWLEPSHLKRWQQGQVEDLESTMQVGEERLGEALALLRSWATARGLVPADIPHVAQT